MEHTVAASYPHQITAISQTQAGEQRAARGRGRGKQPKPQEGAESDGDAKAAPAEDKPAPAKGPKERVNPKDGELMYVVRFPRAVKDQVKLDGLKARVDSFQNTVNLLRESLRAKKVTLRCPPPASGRRHCHRSAPRSACPRIQHNVDTDI